MGTAALGLKIPHFQEQSQIAYFGSTKMGPSKVRYVIASPGPWTTSGLICHKVYPAGFASTTFFGPFWVQRQTVVAGIFQFRGKVA